MAVHLTPLGLRRKSGDGSVCGGWTPLVIADFLCLQLNDRDWLESQSLVLRYLIAHLISRGIRNLVFWSGTSAPSFYTTTREGYGVHRFPGRILLVASCRYPALRSQARSRHICRWLNWQALDVEKTGELLESPSVD